MSSWGQLTFQDASSFIMREMISFHDHAMLVLVMVMCMISFAFLSLMKNTLSCRFIMQAQEVETIWTVIPMLMLGTLTAPSLQVSYLMEEVGGSAFMSVKVVGHQWYWSYEYGGYSGEELSFDSYMLPDSELGNGQYRLLEVDNRVCLPYGTDIRVLVSSSDVIHSWTLPSLGVKVDAIPGRVNMISMYNRGPGVIFGQCSEICGANHSFMPIAVQFVSHEGFLEWFLFNMGE
uniref:cytochrome c oxidase subunit II n=1 Tax=Antonbruunia milenae TaxID=3053535 RepID=UPI0030E010D2